MPSCRLTFFLLAALIAVASASAQTSLGNVTSITPLPNGIEIHAGPATMRVQALRDDVLRIRLTPDAAFPEDASWSILPAAHTVQIPVTPTANGFKTK